MKIFIKRTRECLGDDYALGMLKRRSLAPPVRADIHGFLFHTKLHQTPLVRTDLSRIRVAVELPSQKVASNLVYLRLGQTLCG